MENLIQNVEIIKSKLMKNQLDEISTKFNECLLEGGTLGEKFMCISLTLK